MVQKLKAKNGNTNVHHLKYGQDTLTSEQDISNILGQTFSKKTTPPKVTTQNFKNFKSKKKKTKLNFKSKNLEEYNRPFSLNELRKS